LGPAAKRTFRGNDSQSGVLATNRHGHRAGESCRRLAVGRLVHHWPDLEDRASGRCGLEIVEPAIRIEAEEASDELPACGTWCQKLAA